MEKQKVAYAFFAPTVESLPRKRVYQQLELRLLTALALTTRMEPPVPTPTGSGALPAPMQALSLQNQHLQLLTANVVLVPIVVLRHASSALLVLPHLPTLVLLLLARARLTTGEPVLNARPVRQVVLVPRVPHLKVTANA